MADYKLLIDGALVSGDSAIEVINPATETVFAVVDRASQAQANDAVQAAKRAFPCWAASSVDHRRKMIIAVADAIAKNAENLARILTQEQGKPLAEAMGEVAWSEGYLRHYATLELKGRTIQDDESRLIELRRKPLGVVLGILPWNFPLLMVCWKLGPALLAGNTVVIKPAPTTPTTALALGELMKGILPAGVVNIITDDNDLGAYLTAHPDIAKISFTGSSATGRRIMSSASDSLKRVTLELGGNDPAIVLQDVDVKKTAKGIFDSAFLNAGQVCLAVKRVYVHDTIYEEMCSELARLADAAVVGDGLDSGVEIGPIQNKQQYERVKELLALAKNECEIIAGGEDVVRAGYFIRPTIVKHAADGDSIVDEEQFGPILPIIPFTDIEEVITRVNMSDYGLGASVWMSDERCGIDIASRIESGSVWINQHLDIGPHIPMAGFKASGIGVEQSIEGLEEYTQIQVINVAR